MPLTQCNDMVYDSPRMVPIILSAKQFCHGEPGAIGLSRMLSLLKINVMAVGRGASRNVQSFPQAARRS